MPYMQRRRLTVDADVSGTATWRYKLPRTGNFTCFELDIECQRYATRADVDLVYPLETQISKIELLREATRPIISLTGPQLDASNFWDFKRPNPRRYRQEAATGNSNIFFLLAGRGFYDRQFGFDMAKLGETYLEITHALTADAAEKFDVSTSQITVYAWQWMGPGQPNFTGYFRSRQLAYWTTSAANALKTIEIPVGYPIRRIAVQADTRAKTLGGTFSELEVIVNDGEYSPVHIKSCMDWVMAEAQEYGLNNELGGLEYCPTTEISEIGRWWSYLQSMSVCPYGDAVEINPKVHFISLPARIECLTTGSDEVSFTCRGWGFQKCLRIGFDHEDDGFDLLPTAGLGALDLQVTEAAASLAARCFVQDVISY